MAELASRFVELRKVGKEFHGPCPICGGDDRFHVFADRKGCHCRKCEKSWDAIALIAQMDNCTPGEAALKLSGDAPIHDRPRIAPTATKADAEGGWTGEAWQIKSATLVKAAKSSLLSPTIGKPGRDYLNDVRGLSGTTITEFSLGFDPQTFDPVDETKRPAIVIPWFLPDGRLCAVKYRYIDDLAKSDKNRRFRARKGGYPLLFGAPQCSRRGPIVCIEGEMNALATYQDCHLRGLDSLSFGNENNLEGQQMAADFVHSRGYRQVLIWCDDAERSRRVGKLFEWASPILMQSPRGKDANAILCEYGAGSLWKLISSKIPIIQAKPLSSASNAARESIDRLYPHAPDDLRAKLSRLDSLILDPRQAKAAEAHAIADEVRSWTSGVDPALEGKELRAKIIEIFGDSIRRVA